MAALHRIQWIDAEIRAGRYPNARRLAEQFEISHRQAQRDFEYLRDSLGAPLTYSALRRGFRYEGEAYVLPGPFVSPVERGVLGDLADYYARWAAHREDPVLDGMAALFGRLSGGAARRTGNPAPAYGFGVPFLARLTLTDGSGYPERVPKPLVPYHRGEHGESGLACELHDPDAFLGALVAAGRPYRIEHPRWLRERLEARLKELREANAGTTRCVAPGTVASGHQPKE